MYLILDGVGPVDNRVCYQNRGPFGRGPRYPKICLYPNLDNFCPSVEVHIRIFAGTLTQVSLFE